MINKAAVTHVGRNYLINNHKYVVVNIDEKKVVLRHCERPERSKTLPLIAFAAMQNKNRITEATNTDDFIEWMRHARPFTEKAQADFTRKLSYMKPIVRTLRGTLPRKETMAIIQRVSIEIGDKKRPAYGTVNNWLKKMQGSQMEYMSLAGAISDKPHLGNTIDPRVRSKLDDILEDYFSSRTGVTLLQAHEFLNDDIDAFNAEHPDDLLICPSYPTICRYVKSLDGYKLAVARHGKKKALEMFKSGRSFAECSDPLERVEIDSNEVDIILVDKDGVIIGRPWLTAMIDVYSRCIIGWVISFAAPSTDKTLQVLKHAIIDDKAKEFGGVPCIIVGDNGSEFKGSAYAKACQKLGIDVGYSRVQKGDNKPHIERFFRTMNMQFIHQLPGTTFSNPEHRSDYDSVGKACLTIEHLRHGFERWLDNVYHNAIHRKLQCSPREKWHAYPLQNELIRKNKALVDAICRSSTVCSITSGRVTFKGLSYYSPALSEVENRLAKGDRKVEVLFDPSDLSDVLVVNPFDKSSLIHGMPADPDYQNGLTMIEHDKISKDMREKNLHGKVTRAARKLAFYRELFELTTTLSKKARALLAEIKKPSLLDTISQLAGQARTESAGAHVDISSQRQNDDASTAVSTEQVQGFTPLWPPAINGED